MANLIQEKETRERLLRNVKKECKQLMEVAVTKKFINEDNGCITSLCATIESCLLHGLKRSAMGLFKTNTTITLLQKISKTCDEAKLIVQMCDDYEKAYCSSSTSQPPNGSANQTKRSDPNVIKQQNSFARKFFSNASDTTLSVSPQLMNGRSFSPTYYKGSSCYKLLWIRLALLNKCLIKIIEHLMVSANKYYLEYAIMADPVDGPILASLLIGPCALEYTRMKTCDMLWSDPNADELIQRHKMHSSGQLGSTRQHQTGADRYGHGGTSPGGTGSKLLGLNGSVIAKRKASISATVFDESLLLTPSGGNLGSISPRERESLPPLTPSYLANSTPPPPPVSLFANSAKEYVESLHQNSKSQLIYGKNYVVVSQKDTKFPGYLSLHSNSNGLVLKWTPNQLMSFSSSADQIVPSKPKSGGGYWDYALNIDINTIVYLHCHQSSTTTSSIPSNDEIDDRRRSSTSTTSGASIVLVGQDGIQHPPIQFPKGSHLLQFLTCLEAGLGPDGALDPPLRTEFGKGKVFPRLQRRSIKKQTDQIVSINENDTLTSDSIKNASPSTIGEAVDEEQDGDFVFRIVNSKSNVTVTSVINENPKKLDFSISVQSNSDELSHRLPSIDSPNDIYMSLSAGRTGSNLIESIFPQKKPKLNSFFSWQSKSPKSNRGTHNLNHSFEKSPSSSSVSPKLLRHAETTESVKSAPAISSPSPIPSNSIHAASGSSTTSIDSAAPSLLYSKPEIIHETLDTYSPSLVRSSLKTLCEDMRRQILSRAFYGWLAYHRQIKTINLHLIGLINCHRNVIQEEDDNDDDEDEGEEEAREQSTNKPGIEHDLEMIDKLLSNASDSKLEIIGQRSLEKICEWYLANKRKLDPKLWAQLSSEKNNGKTSLLRNKSNFYKIVYSNGIEQKLRKEVWPFLLEHYTINMNKEERKIKDTNNNDIYVRLMEEWKPFEEHVKNRDVKQSNESSSTLMAFPKTPTNSPSPTTLRGNHQPLYPNISPPAYPKNNLTADAKTNSSTSLFSFNLLKTKTAKPLIRKDSSLSNEVFVSEDKPEITPSSSSFITKFSRNIFSKLMHKNLDQSATIDEDDKSKETMSNSTLDATAENTKSSELDEKLEDEERRKVAREIVSSVISRVIEEMGQPTAAILQPTVDDDFDTKLTQTSSNLSNYDDCCESPVRTPIMSSSQTEANRSLIIADLPIAVRSETHSSIDEVYHDIETEYSNETLNNLIERAETKSQPSAIGVKNGILPIVGIVGPNKRKSLSDQELMESFALQMHRIDKDVTRCDRNYSYFVSNENLKKLKNIMYTYVWENLNIGYIQGMCDLVAPLLVIFDNEPMAYSCFKQLMKRMSSNFPHGTAMDQHFANMRTLIQIVDSDLFEHMHHRGDYTHFYFSYRWFLLDFKRELVYDDTFAVWETIWAAKYVCSAHFHLFIALALVETYRDIIIENNMDFTDIIKFFNEMAEKHNITQILELARTLIQQIQNLIDSKNDSRF